MSGSNQSDDLFMFLRGHLGPSDGIVPDATFQVLIDVTFASNVSANQMGSQAVFLKAGATPVKPQAVLDQDGYLRMNVDKGNQSYGGPAASVVDSIENNLGDATVSPAPFGTVRKRQIQAVAKADHGGNLWLLIGTDSGFEGGTTLYYQQIRLKLIPVIARLES